VHKDRKIYEWTPADYATWSDDKKREKPRIMFNVYSDHAFFYDSVAGRTLAQMKVVDPKRIQRVRLAQHPSDTSKFRRQRFDGDAGLQRRGPGRRRQGPCDNDLLRLRP
jgi:hypothetical protein